MFFHPSRFTHNVKKYQSLLKSSITLCFAIAALILGTAVNLECQTFRLTQSEGNDGLVLLVGLLTYRTRGEEWNNLLFEPSPSCQHYRTLEQNTGFEYTVDSKTRTAWAFSIIAPIVGALLIVILFFVKCGCRQVRSQLCIGICLLLTCLFQGLVLLMKDSSICNDNPALQYLEANDSELASTFPATCEVDAGYNYMIASTVLWALAGLSELFIKTPPLSREHERQDQTVTYVQNKDGTVEEAHVTIVKGAPVAQK